MRLAPLTALLLLIFFACSVRRMAPAADDKAPTVVTKPATALGLDAMSLNGSVHPHGQPTTYYFEYGLTTSYGSKTEPTSLPPRLAAYYHESWDDNTGGWAGWGVKGLEHHAKGGVSGGGFVRFEEPSRDDPNHVDGVGTVHLAKYVYPGPWAKVANLPNLNLAAGDPDFRDAKISIHVRGNGWVPNGAELLWWSQSQSNYDPRQGVGKDWRMANWAYTGTSLNEALASGKWEHVEYRLNNDTNDWSYAGNNRSQPNPERYSYWSINDTQRHLNGDFFHMVVGVDPKNPPKGSIDFDELLITYRNYSLLLPSNGGKLLRAPKSTDDPAVLTDGWRTGAGHTWRSAATPDGPVEFIYRFADPVTLRAVQLHNHRDWPAKDVEVLGSSDDKEYAPLCKLQLPEKGQPNANFAYAVNNELSAKASYLKVRILSGYKKEHWGLAEIEVFGSGAVMLPEDEDNNVNLDVKGLAAGTTYHYRLVAQNKSGTTHGADRTFTVPADAKPLVESRPAQRITATGATLVGRLTPLGRDTQFYFEYGTDTTYGMKTPMTYGGHMIVPRSAFATVSGLKPQTTYHYRLVATNDKGKTEGPDGSFTTAEK
jgi:hypothetical protein